MIKYDVFTDASVSKNGFIVIGIVIKNAESNEQNRYSQSYKTDERPSKHNVGSLVNENELRAIKFALEKLLELDLEHEMVHIHTDSVYVSHIIKKYKEGKLIKNSILENIAETIANLCNSFSCLNIDWTSRKFNLADNVCTKERKTEKLKKVIRHMHVFPQGDDKYLVESKSQKELYYHVDLKEQSCECIRYQYDKSKCTHIMAAEHIKSRQQNNSVR